MARPAEGAGRFGRLGPRSVRFAVQRMADGRGTTTEQAVGFTDIADAAEVHAMIRDIQKGAL